MTTLEQYLQLIFSFARNHGQPFLKWQEQAELRAFVNRELQAINEEKKLVYDENITFDTTATDSGYYDLMDDDKYVSTLRTALKGSTVYVQILELEVVLVEGSPLLDADGLPGLVSVAEANDWVYDYRTVTDAQPQKALQIPPYVLRLIPAPNAVYDITLCGWIQHFDLTTCLDTEVLWLDSGAVAGTAMKIAGELCMVGAEGPALEAAMGLSNRGMARLSKAASRAHSVLQGPQVRGRRTQEIYSLD